MANIKQPHVQKKHSGRIIVDQYEQIKRERQQDGICHFCGNQIPIRLMSSHRNVCAFGNDDFQIDRRRKQQNRSQGKMGCSTYTQNQNNLKNYNQESPPRLASQRNIRKANNTPHSQKKIKNNNLYNFDNGSIRNFSQNKNIKESNHKSPNLIKKNSKIGKNTKIYNINKPSNMQKYHKIQPTNKSIFSQEQNQYFGEAKKKGASKIKKDVKNIWVEQSNKKKSKYKQTQIKRELEKQKRQEKLKRIQNQTQKLRRQQEQLIKQLERQKKTQNNIKKRNISNIKREQPTQARQPSGSNHNRAQPQPRPRQNQPRPNANNRRNQERRRPTHQQSYYEQIPINHPHRTMNFISQTINEQFQMMKQQFEHMNQFFANFVPSNNGIVYFQRNQSEDYSIDSSQQSFGYEQEQEQKGLYDQQIELIPQYSYIKRLGSDDQCPVCINSIKHQEIVRRLPCQHIFHRQCIDQWLKRKAACPVCRDSIQNLGR